MTQEGQNAGEGPHDKRLERRGEEIYDEMYETSSPRGYLSEIKECFAAAIADAESEGLTKEAKRLRARLEHIIDGCRRYFTGAAETGKRPIDFRSCSVLYCRNAGIGSKTRTPAAPAAGRQ